MNAPSGGGSVLPAPVRNWLIARYLSDPTPGRWRIAAGADPEPVVFVRYDSFADYLLTAGYELLPNLDAWQNAGWIMDTFANIRQSADRNDLLPDCIARLNLPPGRHRLVGIRRSVLDAPADPGLQPAGAENNEGGQTPGRPPGPKPKRGTERGEARAKLIPALTLHHQYADGGCLNQEPINNNELARLAGVDKATASAFFKKEFGGHASYKRICRDSAQLAASIKHLNGEFTPQALFGRNPPGEGEPGDDE
jgi:hypothetical protein